MNFEIESATTVKLLDLEVLSQKDREPGANPGVALYFSGLFPNTILTNFDGFLRSTCYIKAAGSTKPQQESIDGVEPITDMPALTAIGEALGQFGWEAELTGYELELDYGLGQAGQSNIQLPDAKLCNFRILCKEGGTVQLKWKAEVPDMSEKMLGKLATLKAQDVKMTSRAPVVKQDDIEDVKPEPEPKPKGKVTPIKPKMDNPFPVTVDSKQTPEGALAAAVAAG